MYPDAQNLPRFFWSFIKKSPLAFAVFFLSPIVLLLDSTVMPYAIKMIIDNLTNYVGIRAEAFEMVKPALCLYIWSWIIIVVVARLQNWWQAYVLPRFEADVRMEALNYVLMHSYHYFSRHFSGNLGGKIKDLPKSLDSIRLILSWNIISSLSVTTATLIVMATVNGWCALILLLWVMVHVFVIVYFGKVVNKAAEKNAADKNTLNGIIIDILSNITSIKLFAKSKKEVNYVQEQQVQEINSNKMLILVQNLVRLCADIPGIFFVSGLLVALIIAWQQGLITVGDFSFVMQSSMVVCNHLWFLGEALSTLFTEVGVANQALTILQEPHEIIDDSNATVLIAQKGRIEFNNVTFHYLRGNKLFQNKSIIIEPGTKVGLVGFSGSGKTTFANLILRFFDVQDGFISIDGQNIKEVTQDSLRTAIAMIPQDLSLFNRTLMENIRYAKAEATDEEVIQAAVSAHCHEFIIKLPEKYQTLVGERGMKLSGGQRQRIAIARAILKNAPIIILDEATSALDSVTEKLIQESLHKLIKGRTTIVIAHRLSTLAEMDRILVFDDGQIVEDGSHQQLLQKSGHYANLWRMQSGDLLPDQE